jgi:hypothetical protein
MNTISPQPWLLQTLGNCIVLCTLCIDLARNKIHFGLPLLTRECLYSLLVFDILCLVLDMPQFACTLSAKVCHNRPQIFTFGQGLFSLLCTDVFVLPEANDEPSGPEHVVHFLQSSSGGVRFQ